VEDLFVDRWTLVEGLFVPLMGFNIQPAAQFNPTPGRDWLPELSDTD
jgi:hypothetical protein